MLLVLILRRHLAKLHLCMTQEMNSLELEDDSGTILRVVDTAWSRFTELTGGFPCNG